ncbi:MAG: fused signal recognition particle receptor [Myxococcota bacterium]|jgi:fused signal recognition particle receptor
MLLESFLVLENQPVVAAADLAVWIFLGVVGGLVYVFVRAINKKAFERLERHAGPETEGDRRRKREERDARREAEAEEKAAEAKARAEAKEAAGPVKKGKPGEKARRKSKGKPGRPAKSAKPEPEPEPARPDLLLPPGKPLGEGLLRTRSEGFVGRLKKVFGGKAIDAATLDKVEEVLFTADIGVRTSEKLLDGLRKKLKANELSDTDTLWSHLKSEAVSILAKVDGKGTSLVPATPGKPHVVLVIGVNGAGKTTTIGKLSHRLVADGKKVLVGAGDTFRAAATDQLAVWAKRVGAELVEGESGADPSSVLFEAVKRAGDSGADVVLLDTAGRLHTNNNLVEELKKVRRVVNKAQEGAPHEVLLVLDATNGQNAIVQALTFGAALDVTGIVLTKLDGTAKGGVILGICDELGLPIHWIGIGERTEDLRPFDRHEFVEALFEGT